MNYAPVMARQGPICGSGECPIAAAFFDHGHIYGMVANLVAAGASLSLVYEPDDDKAAASMRLCESSNSGCLSKFAPNPNTATSFSSNESGTE
jgi:hypothetical protein